ncbi:hypothetical protein, partial [Xanthobacter autotrophicus]|uniref:hypothetical protein n=1 Tax=Xanthobacter autotrophicus TaxID=280 RepID=UPI0037268CAE
MVGFLASARPAGSFVGDEGRNAPRSCRRAMSLPHCPPEKPARRLSVTLSAPVEDRCRRYYI